MNSRPPPVIVWWIIWLVLLTGVFVFYLVLGGTGAAREAQPTPLWLAGLAPLFASVFVRWFLLARATDAAPAFVLFILGMALAETTCFIGLFIAPAQKLELFILSVLGIAQYVPWFAGRFRQS